MRELKGIVEKVRINQGLLEGNRRVSRRIVVSSFKCLGDINRNEYWKKAMKFNNLGYL
jgi:hypothetical protein